ncbi:PAS domain-containing protein [Candidatus Berkiella cookevillensis]|uniref:PAS domain-containing protein n=1 Tax=Candidatus Berkiella cookevillensis TaxID=437022 RepID=A0A0Q9YD30_9GAMM|nr:hypothetical protein [Candidatus Berkiella cookevillensis]MCS5708182.1 PAS domain-containing protein [Candidatus Berkiella cookevillensis]
MQSFKASQIISLSFFTTVFPLIGAVIIDLSFQSRVPFWGWIIAGIIAVYSIVLLRNLKKQVKQYERQFAEENQIKTLLEETELNPTFLKNFEEELHEAQFDAHVLDTHPSTDMIAEHYWAPQLYVAPTESFVSLEYFIKRCQNAILVIDHQSNIQYLNAALLRVLGKTESELSSWKGKALDSLIEDQNVHVKSLLLEALKTKKKSRFLQEQDPSADWIITPLKEKNKWIGYVLEVITPSKNEMVRLEDALKETTARLRKIEVEVAAFVNIINESQIYYQKKGHSYKSLQEASFEHPVLKKGISSVKKLIDKLIGTTQEITDLKQTLLANDVSPVLAANQTSVLTQAILRNLEEFKRECQSLSQHQKEHSRIVNEQKGITQGLVASLDKGATITKACRDKTLSGFEIVTLIVQNLHEFELHLGVMLDILSKTTLKIQQRVTDQEISKTLQTFMQSLTEQIKQATFLAQKNKHRLTILIPSYAGHHFQIGKIQAQWQNCQDLIDTQAHSLSEWRAYHKQIEKNEHVLKERMQELFNLSEKMLRKTLLSESKTIPNSPSFHQFDEIVLGKSPKAQDLEDSVMHPITEK